MRLAVKLKDGKNYLYSEEQTDMIARSINYLKLAQFLMSDTKPKGTLTVLGKKVDIENIKSLEFIF